MLCFTLLLLKFINGVLCWHEINSYTLYQLHNCRFISINKHYDPYAHSKTKQKRIKHIKIRHQTFQSFQFHQIYRAKSFSLFTKKRRNFNFFKFLRVCFQIQFQCKLFLFLFFETILSNMPFPFSFSLFTHLRKYMYWNFQ